MSDRVFEEAYNRVRSRFSEESWFALPPRTVTEEIYKEIRQIDAEQSGADPAEGAAPRSAFAA